MKIKFIILVLIFISCGGVETSIEEVSTTVSTIKEPTTQESLATENENIELDCSIPENASKTQCGAQADSSSDIIVALENASDEAKQCINSKWTGGVDRVLQGHQPSQDEINLINNCLGKPEETRNSGSDLDCSIPENASKTQCGGTGGSGSDLDCSIPENASKTQCGGTGGSGSSTSDDGSRLEIPTDKEREGLPSCNGVQFTTFPVDMDEVYEITPLGNLNPPGHTFPTDHTYIHIDENKSKVLNLYAPADIYLTLIRKSKGGSVGEGGVDYSINFSLCKDVIGYYNHVKTISETLQAIVDSKQCEGFGSSEECTTVISLDRISEGTLLGTVGYSQGNFDFGLFDLSKPLSFIKPERHVERTIHIQCPYDYYPSDMRNVFYNLFSRDDGSCNTNMHDVRETLKGAWFHTSAPDENVVDWKTHLGFFADVDFSNIQNISIGGIVRDAGWFSFTPKSSGTINRDFLDTAPGTTYCYEPETIVSSRPAFSGKIVVKFVEDQILHIDHQSGTCSGSEEVEGYEIYKR